AAGPAVGQRRPRRARARRGRHAPAAPAAERRRVRRRRDDRRAAPPADGVERLTTTVAPPRRPTGGDPVARPDAAARPGETLAPPTGAGRVAAEQALVAGGQLAAGVGNLVFAVLAARLFEPRGFAQLAAFLALYL